MSVARINIKNIDYFKFRKLIIDGSRDDYSACSKEVKAFCDCVQSVNFRDEEFDDITDRRRFEEICLYYKQIMSSKRIESTDMRIKSGWWGDHKNSYSAGKLKPSVLRDVLIQKTKDWCRRHSVAPPDRITERIDGPGLFVLKHKDRQCFQYVGCADRIFARIAEKMKLAFDGTVQEPLSALLIMSMASDWEFYFMNVDEQDDERILRILENDLILKHDSIWPHGLNFRLNIDSLLEVSEFRRSCIRYSWPPSEVEPPADGKVLNVERVRKQLNASQEETSFLFDKAVSNASDAKTITPHKSPKKLPKPGLSTRPEWRDPLDNSDSEVLDDSVSERPSSPMSDISTATYIVEHVDGAAVKLEYESLPDAAGASRPVAFTVPLEGVASPKKVRPTTVTLASRKARSGQTTAPPPLATTTGDFTALLDNKNQKPTLDKSPLATRRTAPPAANKEEAIDFTHEEMEHCASAGTPSGSEQPEEDVEESGSPGEQTIVIIPERHIDKELKQLARIRDVHHNMPSSGQPISIPERQPTNTPTQLVNNTQQQPISTLYEQPINVYANETDNSHVELPSKTTALNYIKTPDVINEPEIEPIHIVPPPTRTHSGASPGVTPVNMCTVRANRYGMKKLNEWCQMSGRTLDLRTISASSLNEVLKQFYSDVPRREKTGTTLKINSLKNVRYALHRILTDEQKRLDFNIITGSEFAEANEVFDRMIKEAAKDEERVADSKPPISVVDLNLLDEYFTKYAGTIPQVLVHAVWFHLCIHFGKRTRDEWCRIRTDTFKMDVDTHGEPYIFMDPALPANKQLKGHGVRMYGVGVQYYREYLAKLNPSAIRLFQNPNKMFVASNCSAHWYESRPMGKNTLGKMMQLISTAAGLSRTYCSSSIHVPMHLWERRLCTPPKTPMQTIPPGADTVTVMSSTQSKQTAYAAYTPSFPIYLTNMETDDANSAPEEILHGMEMAQRDDVKSGSEDILQEIESEGLCSENVATDVDVKVEDITSGDTWTMPMEARKDEDWSNCTVMVKKESMDDA